MNRFQSSMAYAALLLGVIAFASSFVRTTSGQTGVSAPVGVGRYQVAAAGMAGGAVVYITDSVTGETWSRSTDGWKDLGTPIKVK